MFEGVIAVEFYSASFIHRQPKLASLQTAAENLNAL